MSLDSHADNIRRIAKPDKIKGALGVIKERDPIPGSVVPFIDGALSTSTTSETSNAVNGDSDSVEQTPVDPTDPNTFVRKTTGSGGAVSGEYDAEEVLDGDAGPQTPKDDTSSDQTSSSDGGSLNSLTGLEDCTSGQCVKLHIDGEFPDQDGWDDPNTPPTMEASEWTLGYSRFSVEENYVYFAQASSAWAAAIVALEDGGKQDVALTGVDVMAGRSTPTGHPSSMDYDSYHYSYNLGGATTFYSLVKIYYKPCTPSASDAACPLSAPDQFWDEDGCYDLALIDGKFQTSQYDSDAPANAGGSIIDLCTTSGRNMRIYATAQGGTMVVETSGGAPTGTAKVYASDGTMQAAGDATDSFMDQFLPK